MRRLERFIGAMALALLTMATAASARAPADAARSVGYSIWSIDGTTVRLRFMLPTGAAPALAAPGHPAPDTPAVASAVSNALRVSSASGDCAPIDQGEGVGQIYTMALTPGMDRFEMVFDCPDANGIRLHDGLLFDRVPGHLDYATVRVGSARPALLMFTAKQQTLVPPSGGRPLTDTPIVQQAQLGALGMLARIDRLIVVTGLLLLARRWRDLSWMAGALSLGYAASIAAALGGLVTSGASVTEGLVGILIVLIGVASLRSGTGAPMLSGRAGWLGVGAGAVLVAAAAIAAGMLQDLSAGVVIAGLGVFALAQAVLIREPGMRWLAWAPVALFGLLNGMGPANDLAVLQPPPGQLAPILIGRDAGAAATAMGLVAIVMAAIWLGRRWLRPLQTLAEDFAGAGFVGLGLFWFVSRLYG